MSIHWRADLLALLMLMAANTAPVLAAGLLGRRLAAPIDARVQLRDGQPLFGSHKTWRGLVAGILAAALVAGAAGLPAAIGAAFGALALCGDLLSSFVKRRLSRASGTWMPFLDQLPEALLPLLVMKHWFGLNAMDIAVTAGMFSLAGIVTSRLNDVLAGQRPPGPTGTATPKE
jgi:CDP-2,3-bis-(O-geranylgeranyl)-sn-glycerol synthase